mmetsp:Transcript_36242/g.114333  ORF Transcript_36242/g.114333 Transcript_36242/m.114333 type:complete len:311 (+) Transcript_36242:230-1162(+)
MDVGGAWAWYRSFVEVPKLAERVGVEAFMQRDKGRHVIDYGIQGIRTITDPLDAPKMRFKGGAYAITTKMAEKLSSRGVSIVTSAQVKSITGGTGVAVECQDGRRWEASAVLVAVPPRVALPPMVEWTPPIDVKLQKVMRQTPTWMAETTKFLAVYSKPFWREEGFSGDGMSQSGPLQQIYDSCDGDGEGGPFALCAFIYNDATRAQDDAELKAAALSQLGRMWGAHAEKPEEVHIHRWGAEDFTAGQGGGRGGGHDAMGHAPLRETVIPGVWQCAAETDDHHPGVMEGAILAGRRAAEQVATSGLLGSR